MAVCDDERETKLGYVPADETGIVRTLLDADPDAQCLVVWQVVQRGERKAVRVVLPGGTYGRR